VGPGAPQFLPRRAGRGPRRWQRSCCRCPPRGRSVVCTVFFARVELVEEYRSGPEGAPSPATEPTRQFQAFLSFNILFYGAVSLVYGRLVEAADAPGGSHSLYSSASYQTVIPAVVATRPSLQRYQSRSGCYAPRGYSNPSRPIAAVINRDGLQQPRGQHLQMLCMVCLSYLSTTDCTERPHTPMPLGHLF